MNQSKTSQTSGKNGCGCGKAPAGCSCGGQGCPQCNTQGFVRPNFFAGQLLTEDDLRALTDYVTAKGRLHNQAFFGAGVVNGLAVTCNACDATKVTVHPGYAIDCCGNDLVLPCAQELDIRAMLRKLSIERLGGLDCGDPCPPAESKGDVEKPDPGLERVRRKFFLYAQYCETETDPVSAYATDEACGDMSCVPTRVREGVRFELRCPEASEAYDLFVRVGECIGDFVGLEKTAGDGIVLRQAADYNQDALDALSGNANFTEADATQMEKLTKELGESLTALDGDPSKLVDAVNLVRRLGGLATLYRYYPGHEANIGNARDTLRSADKALNETVLGTIPALLMKQVAMATMDLNRRYALPADSEPTSDTPELPLDGQLFARGGVFTRTLQGRFAEALDALRTSLYERLSRAMNLTDCVLRKDVPRVIVPPISTAPEITRGDVELFISATGSLVSLMLRFLLDCICNAFNPPASRCDDTGVLLACLTLDQCDVVDICNMERTFVLSPQAFRYWLPSLGWIGAILEYICCNRLELGEPRLVVDQLKDPRSSLSGVLRDAVGRAIESYYGRARVRSEDFRRLGDLLGMFGSVSFGEAEVASQGVRTLGDRMRRTAAERVRERVVPQARRGRAITAEVPGRNELTAEEIDALTKRIIESPELLSALAKAVAKAKTKER